MVDPNNITNYNLSFVRLQEHMIFWLLVAGKTAKVIAKSQKNVFDVLTTIHRNQGYPKTNSPFRLIRDLCERRAGHEWLARILKDNGIGCHGVKAKGMIELAFSGLNLKTCTPDDLEQISGIGMKTSRCFIVHSRKNCQYACLDTHLLKFLRDLGYKDVPETTPTGKKYKAWEAQFLSICQKAKRNTADLDLLVWRIYSKHSHLKKTLIDTISRLL